MEKVKVTCTQTNVTLGADVLRRSDKSMRVALDGTQLTLNLNRTDARDPYKGNHAGLEFTSRG